MDNEVLLDLHAVRHGETDYNLTQDTFVGGRSPKATLTFKGRMQTSRRGRLFRQANIDFDLRYASSLIRTHQSMEEISLSLYGHILQYHQMAEFDELSHGEWEGQRRDQVWTPEMQAELARLGMDFAAPGGESPNDCKRRVGEGFDILAETAHAFPKRQPLRVLLVSHSMAIRCGVMNVAPEALPEKFWEPVFDNARVTRFTYSRDGKWRFLGMNMDDVRPLQL